MEKCKICGEKFKMLCKHVRHAHGITSKEYYDKFFKSENEGKCLECGKPTRFKNFNDGYRLFCSSECSHKSVIPREKARKTLLKNYGVENPAQSEEVRNKMKKTNLERYGAENIYASEYGKQRIKETNLKKYGVEYASSANCVRKKRRKTMLNKYGETCYTKTDKCKERVKKTNMERYGKEYFLQTDEYLEKSRLTNLKKYGVERVSQSPDVQAKMRKTCLERYGVECILQRSDIQAASHSQEIIQKQNETKRKNKTFNTSRPEKELKIRLQELFPDLKAQYKSDVYPFACDFYIPSLDLYIEYNGTWTHGGRFFDKDSPDDVGQLAKWKDRAETSKFYAKAIETWTIRDVNKLETAIKNNLNYVAWFNEEQANDWIEAQKKIRIV